MNFKILFIVVSSVFSIYFVLTEACTCLPNSQEQQTIGCKGQFIAVVNVTGEVVASMLRRYSYTVLYDFTPTLSEHRSIENMYDIVTAQYEAGCGVMLKLGHAYLLKGALPTDGPHLAKCTSYVKMLHHIPNEVEAKIMFAQVVKLFC